MRDAVGVYVRAAENQHAVEICPLQQRHKQIEFLLCGYGINCVRNRFRRRTADADFDQLGIAQDPGGQTFDLRWERGGEEQGLAVRRNLFNDAAHVRQEPHVEHAIDFIEDEKLYLLQSHRALFEQIEQSSRRGDEHIDTAFEFLALFSISHAAMHQGDAEICKAAIITKCSFDLRSKFTRWLEHETSKRAVLRQSCKNRK